MSSSIMIDAAGASMGGAARFLLELDRFIRCSTESSSVTVLGRDRPLDSKWVLERELRSLRGTLRIALNNLSFSAPGGLRLVLLRNALHFASSDDLLGLGYRPSRALNVQVPLIRLAARRADVIVVPCSAMAERVTHCVPSLRARVVVRPHPVSSASWIDTSVAFKTRSILVPVLYAPYKQLDQHLRALLTALDILDDAHSLRICVTATPEELPAILADDRVDFLGRLSPLALDDAWRRATAIYFPTSFEAFGYPLAEARAAGKPVIAQQTLQNAEIAGPALMPFVAGIPESLASAVGLALAAQIKPDRSTFDPNAYFTWLLGHAK